MNERARGGKRSVFILFAGLWSPATSHSTRLGCSSYGVETVYLRRGIQILASTYTHSYKYIYICIFVYIYTCTSYYDLHTHGRAHLAHPLERVTGKAAVYYLQDAHKLSKYKRVSRLYCVRLLLFYC